jgi:hypothetical protein
VGGQYDENATHAVSPNTGLIPPASLPVKNRCTRNLPSLGQSVSL